MSVEPFEGLSYPRDPTLPTTAPHGYVTPTEPERPGKWEPPRTPEEIELLRVEFFIVIMRQFIEVLQGFFSPGDGSVFEQLFNAFSSIPFVGQYAKVGNELWNALFGVFTGVLDPTGKSFSDAMSAGSTTVGTVAGTQSGSLSGSALNIFNRYFNVLTTGALAASGLSGTTGSGTSTAVSGSSVGSGTNAATNPGFNSASSVNTDGTWSWFGTGGHS